MKKMIIGLVAGMLIGSATAAVAATSPTVQAVVSKYAISVDGQQQTLKSDPLVYNGTTYLPVREVAGLTGYDLQFDAKSKKIDLQSKAEGVEKPVSVETKTQSPQWVSLSQLSKYGITATGNLTSEITLKSGDQTLTVELPNEKKGIVNANSPSGSVGINFSEDGTMLNLTDLKNIGLTQ